MYIKRTTVEKKTHLESNFETTCRVYQQRYAFSLLKNICVCRKMLYDQEYWCKLNGFHKN